jgi:nicotinate-nucleotide adenylyltransferase
MRVAFFGGSFDPPHRGHIAVAQAAAQHFALDQVLFAPAGLQPLKTEGAQASFADRLAMTKLLCADIEPQTPTQFLASALDAPRADGTPNYTIDALQTLRAQTPAGAELYVLTGADAFAGLRAWRAPDALLAAADWIVVSRPGLSLAEAEAGLALTTAQRARVHPLDGIAHPARATDLRAALARGEDGSGQDGSGLLTAAVLAYIREHKLYR